MKDLTRKIIFKVLRVGSFESVEKQDYLGLKFLMHKPDLLCFPSCLYKISLPHDTSSSQSQFSPSWNLPNNLSVPLDWISVWVSVSVCGCGWKRERKRKREDHLFIEVILLWLQTFKIYAVWKMEKRTLGLETLKRKILNVHRKTWTTKVSHIVDMVKHQQTLAVEWFKKPASHHKIHNYLPVCIRWLNSN